VSEEPITRDEIDREAAAIGDDSWELLNYQQARGKSAKKILEALWADDDWLERHATVISHRIQRLIRRIENEGIAKPRNRRKNK